MNFFALVFVLLVPLAASTIIPPSAVQQLRRDGVPLRPGFVLKYIETHVGELPWQTFNDTTSSFQWEVLTLKNEAYADYEALALSSPDLSEDSFIHFAAGTDLAIRDTDSFSCFGSGSWAKINILLPLIQLACEENFRVGLAVGTTQTYRTRQTRDGQVLVNASGNLMELFINYFVEAAIQISGNICEDALSRLINSCHGDNSDTRGGRVGISNNNGEHTQLTIDPQTDNCGC